MISILLRKLKNIWKPQVEARKPYNDDFVYQHRWILDSEDTLEPTYLRKVRFDFIKKLIFIEAYEIAQRGAIINNIDDWLNNGLSNPLRFQALNAYGESLYTYKFYGLQLLSNKVTFAYTAHKLVVRKLCIKYSDIMACGCNKGITRGASAA